MPPAHTPTVSLISLGCPRTLVDSEVYLGKMVKAGFTVVDGVGSADVAVINTCSFIQESIQESIDTVLDAVELKKQGKLKAVIVAGCLVQRFKDGLIKELPDVDGFVGVDGFGDIETVAQQVLARGRGTGQAGPQVARVNRHPASMYQGHPDRVALTAPHYAYLKVSEGCLKGCSFCVIPKIKGPLSSRPIDDLVEEAKQLIGDRGVKELIVVGQDTSDYGVDLYGKPRIAELLQRLGRLDGLRWIRLLYCHPHGVTREIIETIRDVPAVCKYLDMAIEHADDGVLARMNRLVSRQRLLDTIGSLRRQIPGIALRTSIIVGFPGETDAAFERLLSFVQEVKFERLGTFRYSHEEGAASFRYADQVPEPVAQARFDRLMQLQQEIASDVNRRWLGQTLDVLIDERDPDDAGVWLGRIYADCPEVDGIVYVHPAAGGVNSPAPLAAGQMVRARITDTYEYDLVADLAS